MFNISNPINTGSILKYLVVIDPKKQTYAGFTRDSFSDLLTENGVFNTIAKEVNQANMPALIDFFFVKDVQNTITPSNNYSISDDNLIKRLILPLMPTSFEFEGTVNKGIAQINKNFEEIDQFVKEFSKTKSSIEEQNEDFDYMKKLLITYLFHPREDANKDFESALLEVKKELKYLSFKDKEIIDRFEDCYRICKNLIGLAFSFIEHKDINLYSAYKNAINPKQPQTDFQKRFYQPIETFNQLQSLALYIKNRLSYSYHLANEMLSKYANVIKNLDIYGSSEKDTPYGTMLQPKTSQSKYIVDVIDFVLETVRSYGHETAEIKNNSSSSNGKCLSEPDDEFKYLLNQKMEGFINNIPQNNEPKPRRQTFFDIIKPEDKKKKPPEGKQNGDGSD